MHALEKEMATHSSVLAWRIPGTEEPGGLPSMGSHRVGHDWSDLATAASDWIFTIKTNSEYSLKETQDILSAKSSMIQIKKNFFNSSIFGETIISKA